MYEVRKQVKMKVSLRRKIHIIALPQGTGKACLSADQSETTPGKPSSAAVDSPVVVVTAFSAIRVDPDSVRQQHSKQDQPHQQQVMPVDGTQFHAQAQINQLDAVRHSDDGLAPNQQAPEQVQPVHAGKQVEK